MANLHIFGDSFSVDWQAYYSRRDSKDGLPGQNLYYRWVKRKPLHFAEIIQKEFKLNKIFYHAKSASDNYRVMESIGKRINSIKKDDYVCIGWSDITRYRIIIGDVWVTIFANGFTAPPQFEKDIEKPFVEQTWRRDSGDIWPGKSDLVGEGTNLTIKEIANWQNILLKSLPKNTIFWSPFDRKQSRYPWTIIPDAFETIADATDGVIDDQHASEKGHEQIGEYLTNTFKNNPYKKQLL